MLRDDLHNFDGVAVFHVLGCKDIMGAGNLSDVPDPYLTFCSGTETSRTSVVKNSSSPLFDENVVLLVADPSEPISIDVWDRQIFVRDQYLGSHAFLMPLEMTGPDSELAKPEWSEHTKLGLMLNTKPAGSIMFRFQYHPFNNFSERALADPALWPKLCGLISGVGVESGFESVLKAQREPKPEDPDLRGGADPRSSGAPAQILDLLKGVDRVKDLVVSNFDDEGANRAEDDDEADDLLPGLIPALVHVSRTPSTDREPGAHCSPQTSRRSLRAKNAGGAGNGRIVNDSPQTSRKNLLATNAGGARLAGEDFR
jgi:hypothetical protein